MTTIADSASWRKENIAGISHPAGDWQAGPAQGSVRGYTATESRTHTG